MDNKILKLLQVGNIIAVIITIIVNVLAMLENKRYNDLNTYLRKIFGYRVQKITVDAGLTCPNRDGTISHGGCIYCNIRGSGTGAYAKGMSVTRQLTDGKKSLSKRYKAKKFIAYFQSFSNTYGPLEQLKLLYDEALAVENIVGLSIGTRPDCVDQSVLALLQISVAETFTSSTRPSGVCTMMASAECSKIVRKRASLSLIRRVCSFASRCVLVLKT